MSQFKQFCYYFLSIFFWLFITQRYEVGFILIFIFLIGIKIDPKFLISDKKLGSIMDGCLMLLLMTVILFWNNNEKMSEVFINTMMWLPLIFSPFFILLYFSKEKEFDPRSLWFFFRFRIKHSVTQYPIPSKQVVWGFMAICFLSASVGDVVEFYYPGIALLVFCVMLLEDKRKGFRLKRSCILMFVLVMGFGLHNLIFNANKYLKNKSMEWMLQYTNGQNSLRKQWMAIGEHGKIQLSQNVIMRVQSDVEGISYYKGSHYDQLLSDTHWFNTHPYEEQNLIENSDIILNKNEKHDQKGKIWFQGMGDSWIPLPESVSKCSIVNIPKIELWKGNMLRVPPPFGWLEIDWLGHSSLKRNDIEIRDKNDYLLLPEDDEEKWKSVLDTIVITKNLPLDDVLLLLRKHFRTFKYSLDALSVPEKVSPIFYFLESSKTGHCEHFATAATMLLRANGVRARYVTGYVVREYSAFQDMWLVRGRDAHAWVEVWHDDHWERFEPTPPADQVSQFGRGVKDRWDWLMFQIDKWRFDGHTDHLKNVAPWGIGLVMLYLLLRMANMIDFKKKQDEVTDSLSSTLPDTGVKLLEETLTKNGLPRLKNETWSTWLNRLEIENNLKDELLSQIKNKHLKLIYRESNITESDKLEMNHLCLEFVNKFKKL